MFHACSSLAIILILFIYKQNITFQVQERNFFPPGALTHYGMPAGGESVQRCWDMCLEKSHFYTRKEIIDRYNRLDF